MVKYVRYGHPTEGIPMYVVSMFRTDFHDWKIEVSICDDYGIAISEPIAWDIFPGFIEAYKYFRKQYKEFREYVNERC